MATYTADAAQGGLIRAVYDGVTTVVSTYIANGTSISTGDIYVMANVPNGATIIGLTTWGRSLNTGGIVFDLGYISSALTTNSVFGQFTISATDQYVVRTPTTLPFTVALSDDAANQFVTVRAVVASGTITNTGTFGLVIQYAVRGAGRP